MTAVADTPVLPAHIGYIVDGNRRWARANGLPAYEGHLAGYNTLKDIVIDTIEAGVKYVTIYAFSTENHKREAEEVNHLMKLAHRAMKKDIGDLIKHNIRVRFIGTEDKLSAEVIRDMRETEEVSRDLTAGTVIVCFNYGGQREIADAAAACVRDGLSAEEVTEEAIAARLYAPDVPPLDMVVRTSGEQRLSNFMVWRVVYSEFMFIDKFWPDMRTADVHAVIAEYQQRQRRLGR